MSPKELTQLTPLTFRSITCNVSFHCEEFEARKRGYTALKLLYRDFVSSLPHLPILAVSGSGNSIVFFSVHLFLSPPIILSFKNSCEKNSSSNIFDASFSRIIDRIQSPFGCGSLIAKGRNSELAPIPRRRTTALSPLFLNEITLLFLPLFSSAIPFGQLGKRNGFRILLFSFPPLFPYTDRYFLSVHM